MTANVQTILLQSQDLLQLIRLPELPILQVEFFHPKFVHPNLYLTIRTIKQVVELAATHRFLLLEVYSLVITQVQVQVQVHEQILTRPTTTTSHTRRVVAVPQVPTHHQAITTTISHIMVRSLERLNRSLDSPYTTNLAPTLINQLITKVILILLMIVDLIIAQTLGVNHKASIITALLPVVHH